MKLIPLKDVKDDAEFWKGTRFRSYNVGMNVTNNEDDYYEYMLVEIPGGNEHMLLTCVQGYKSGSALALVKTALDKTKLIVDGKSIKKSLGIDESYLIEE